MSTSSSSDLSTHPSTDQRVAVVTGGSRGIGRACVEALARDGIAVVVGFGGNKQAADSVVQTIVRGGGHATAVSADVADEDAVADLFDIAERTYGGVDIVVHAAGKLLLSPLVDLDLTQLDELLRTNIRGTFVVDQQAARRLRAGGSIVNFSTSVVGTSFPSYGAYVATKGAVEALTMVLARELRGRDITVNAVAPGATATDMFLHGKNDADLARLADAVPLQRLGTPEDIAETVAFLTSRAGHWINGQVVRVNGGLV